MPSLHHMPDRHVVIDRRLGEYLCFPDIAHSGDGQLLCVYNEFEKHVGTRRRLLLKRSADGGRSWSAPQLLNATNSHCPRIARLHDGLLLLMDDAQPCLMYSTDHGRNWGLQQGAGLGHGLLDRALELNHETLLSAGHLHRGAHPQPKINQGPTEQMAYISYNRGRKWEMLSVIAHEKCLVLCEASIIPLDPFEPHQQTPRQRLLALMRENSHVGEPMYACLSEDGGATWGPPLPSPLIGHRPTLGWTASGRLLVTYRDVGPDPGTKAWLGTLEELLSGFAVHGLHPAASSQRFTEQGLLVQCDGKPESAVRYVLRPLTDPEFATASLEAEVLVRSAAPKVCGLRLGQWWSLLPEGIVPMPAPAPGEEPPEPLELVPFAPDVFHTIRVDYTPGQCSLYVDGEHRGDYPVERMSVTSRPVVVGVLNSRAETPCDVILRQLRLEIEEPRMGRSYAWSWRHDQGALPDHWIDSRVLELQNDRLANPADFGYSGWVELPAPDRGAGEFFCVYHHGDGDNADYRPGYSAHVAGTRFFESDFGESGFER